MRPLSAAIPSLLAASLAGCSVRSVVFTERGPALFNASLMRDSDEDHYTFSVAPDGTVTLESRTLGADEQGAPKAYLAWDAAKALAATAARADLGKARESGLTERARISEAGATDRASIDAASALGSNPEANASAAAVLAP